MTNEEILRAAIEKAVKKGYDLNKIVGEEGEIDLSITNFDEVFLHRRFSGMSKDVYLDSFTIVFSHDFAKAFWGEDPFSEFRVEYRSMKVTDEKYQGWEKLETWQYHLQQMVLEEDPIKYLEQFI